MPSKCSVPNCRGNYKNEEYVSVFRFPRNEPLRSLWLKSIGREDFNPTIHSTVCERHFSPSDVLRESNVFDEKLGKFITTKLNIPKLKEGAIPSIFPQVHRNERVKKMRISKAREEAEVFEESTVIYEADFNDLSELEAFMQFFDLDDFWSVVKGPKTVAFVHVNWKFAPKIDLSVVVDENLSVIVFHGNVKFKLLKNFKFPKIVKSVTELNMILNELKRKVTFESEKASEVELVKEILNSLAKKSEITKSAFLFLKEQVSVLTEKHGKTFSTDMLVFSTLLYAMAPHAYKYLTNSNCLVLPDPDTIRKLYMPLQECTPHESSQISLQYAKERFELRTESDRCVVLQVEEIYLKPFFEGKEVNIAGMSCPAEIATSMYVFMIASLCSPFRDIIHIMPVKTLNARDLNLTLKQIIVQLEEVGYSILAVITDNSYLNKKIMSFFSEPPLFNSIVYKHPVHSSRPLFHLIGFVHLLKSVRNDWMNKKTCDECILYPSFSEPFDSQICKKASYNALRKVHATESLTHTRNGSRLTLKTLSPNYADKQDPKLVLRIFCPRVTEVLLKLGEEKELPHYQETVDFIRIFHTWWSVINPRSLLKETHLNGHELPLSTSDENYDFLKKFLDWLDGWSNMKWDSGMLRAETFSVLRLSTYALVELTAYCKNELGVNFIFPGNFLTDCQITRFGYYKSHPGIQKFIPPRQLNKEEQILKSTIFCGLSLIEKNDVNLSGLHLMDSINLMDENFSLNSYVPLMITDEDFTSIQVDVSALIYLGAYSIRSVLKNLQCSECENFILTKREVSLPPCYDLMVNLTEEKIRHPPRNVINIVHCIFIVLHKLCKERKNELIRYKQPNKTLAYNLTMNIIESLDLSLDFQECGAGHSSEKVLKMIVKAVVYTILNNYLKNTFNIFAPPVKKSKIDILLNNPKYDIGHLLKDGI